MQTCGFGMGQGAARQIAVDFGKLVAVDADILGPGGGDGLALAAAQGLPSTTATKASITPAAIQNPT